jgi:AraC-like DNA-binding protein
MLLDAGTFKRLCQARDRLCDLDESPLSIRDVAREAGISPFHFIRQFEALFGSTPHQFRIRARLDYAKALLADGQLSVTDVCMEVGFSSLGSFSTLFARRVGSSPSAYRHRARTLVQVPGTLAAPPIPGCLSLLGLLPKTAFRNFREA